MSKPWIAVILLDHPTLKMPGKTIYAADALKDLKSQGQAWWARYLGLSEYIIWADVPNACILTQFSLLDLIEDQTAATLLSLPEFTAGKKTRELSRALRDKQIKLSLGSAGAIGRVAKLFGMDGLHVGLRHIEDFVARLCDGWSINYKYDAGMHDRNIAAAFATALGSRAHQKEDVMDAFFAGMKQGTETLAYFARRRRPTARRGKSA
jgi:hypothetical protein